MQPDTQRNVYLLQILYYRKGEVELNVKNIRGQKTRFQSVIKGNEPTTPSILCFKVSKIEFHNFILWHALHETNSGIVPRITSFGILFTPNKKASLFSRKFVLIGSSKLR